MRLQELLNPLKGRTIAVAAAHDERVIQCVGRALEQGLAGFVLIGDTKEMGQLAAQNNVDLSKVQTEEERDAAKACERAVQLVLDGKVHALMKGMAKTGTFIHSILTRKDEFALGNGLISQVSVFDIPGYHKALFLTDPGINIEPDLAQKVEILKNVIGVASALGVQCPKVACVAPVEKASDKIVSTTHAEALSRMQGVFGNAMVEGPLPVDIALSAEAAAIKGVTSQVCGDADILLFPAIESGNAVYKTLTTFAGATVAGIAAGLKVPLIVTSRSDTDEAREISIRLALSIR